MTSKNKDITFNETRYRVHIMQLWREVQSTVIVMTASLESIDGISFVPMHRPPEMN